jgi:hypothetical protein
MTSRRAHGKNVRKMCGCDWRRWPKCEHPWYFSFKPKGGPRHRFSLEEELRRRITSKIEAENEATTIRNAILDGTLRRSNAPVVPTAPTPAADVVTVDHFAPLYLERAARPQNDVFMLNRLRAFVASDGPRLGAWALTAITEDTNVVTVRCSDSMPENVAMPWQRRHR